MESAWATALVAAVTAALVTYALEYAAKPWLEVRKVRILAEAESRRRLMSALKRLVMNKAATEHLNAVQTHPTLFRDAVSESLEATRAVQVEMSHVNVRQIPPDILSLLSGVSGRLNSVYRDAVAALETQRYEDATSALVESMRCHAALDVVTSYLLMPRWRVLGRRRLRERARQLYGEVPLGAVR